MRISSTQWRTGFALFPVVIQDEWVWLEKIQYRVVSSMFGLPFFELKKNG